MEKLPNRADAPRVSTDEERAEEHRRHDEARRALYPEPPAAPAFEGRVAQLEQWAARLQQQLLDVEQALREETIELNDRLLDEVRTRRLVVVDDHGVERVVAECPDSPERAAEVRVMAAEDADTHVSMYAANDMEGGEPSAQLDLSVDGSIHAHLIAAPAGAWHRPERPAFVKRGDVRSVLMLAGEEVSSGYSTDGGRPRKADG